MHNLLQIYNKYYYGIIKTNIYHIISSYCIENWIYSLLFLINIDN